MKICLALLLLVSPVFALDPAKLDAIHPAMEDAVKAKLAAGIVTLVMEKGKIVHHDAAGMADIAKGRAMEKDALFWIASMTKSVNATAVMTLVDAGKLALDEPASKWLPELAKVTVEGGATPEKAITLRMLLSHTAGIAFPARKPTDGAISLKSYVASLIKTPLAFQPGSSYEYGFGPTVAGCIIEIVSGMKYEDFMRTRLFEPLGMKDTTFHPTDEQRARIARTYKMDEDTHEFVPGRTRLERRIEKTTLDALSAKGHIVQVSGEWSNGSAPTVILFKDGVLDGGADPRRQRFIFGR